MTSAAPPATARLSVLPDEDVRAGCLADLDLLDGIAQAATALALEIQRRTMAALAEDMDGGVPSRAVIAFGRAARVQRQTILLRHRLRRELRGGDRDAPPPPEEDDDAPASAPSAREVEDRIDAALDRLAEGDGSPDHQVERLGEDAAERLEREGLEAGLARSLHYHLAGLREELDTAARLAGVEPPSACRGQVQPQSHAAKTPVIPATGPPMAGRRAGIQGTWRKPPSSPLGPGSPLSHKLSLGARSARPEGPG